MNRSNNFKKELKGKNRPLMKRFKDSDNHGFYFIDLYKTGQIQPYYEYRYQVSFFSFGLLFGKNPIYGHKYK